MAKSKRIMLAVVVVAVAGIAYVAVNGPTVTNEGAQGTMGAAERHQNEKSRYYQELNNLEKAEKAQKVEALGRVAATFESAPAEGEKLLEEQGWSKPEFDKMIETVQSDDELKIVFEEAKKKASVEIMKASQP